MLLNLKEERIKLESGQLKAMDWHLKHDNVRERELTEMVP